MGKTKHALEEVLSSVRADLRAIVEDATHYAKEHIEEFIKVGNLYMQAGSKQAKQIHKDTLEQMSDMTLLKGRLQVKHDSLVAANNLMNTFVKVAGLLIGGIF